MCRSYPSSLNPSPEAATNSGCQELQWSFADMKQDVDDGLADDDDEAEGDDGGVPHVYQFEVGRPDRGLVGGGEQSRQGQLGREGYHDAVGEVVKLRSEARD